MPCCRTPETLLISTEAITQRMKAMFLKLGCERMRKLFEWDGNGCDQIADQMQSQGQNWLKTHKESHAHIPRW